MPKLNTTVDKIQLTTNLINSSSMSSNTPVNTWSDAQYPSAQVLYRTYQSLTENINTKYNTITNSLSTMNTAIGQKGNPLDAYPIGSIYVSNKTATKTINGYSFTDPLDPSSPYALNGGTWELIDVAFRSTAGPLSDIAGLWTSTTGATLHADSFAWISDHSIRLHFGVNIPKGKTVGDGNHFSCGKINFNAVGLGEGVTLATKQYGWAFSESGNCICGYELGVDGALNIIEVICRSSASAVSNTITKLTEQAVSVFFDLTISTNDTLCDDIQPHALNIDWCDKFYWKRIS